jgi:hypothetical protein
VKVENIVPIGRLAFSTAGRSNGDGVTQNHDVRRGEGWVSSGAGDVFERTKPPPQRERAYGPLFLFSLSLAMVAGQPAADRALRVNGIGRLSQALPE